MPDKAAWSRYQWNAYVVAGKTHDERKRRLEEVPDEWRATVKRHAQTVYAIQKFNERKRREREESNKRRKPAFSKESQKDWPNRY